MVEDITICIKTWNRPDCCARLIDSIRQYYPDQPIIVCDDSSVPGSWENENIKEIIFDHEVGLSRGRNEMLRAATTKYAVVCDDDFVFNEHTDLELWKSLFESRDVSVLGACYTVPDTIHGGVLWKNVHGVWDGMNHAYHSFDGDVYSLDFCANFLLLDVETVLGVGAWDEEMMLHEHGPFFINLKMHGVKVGVTNKVYCNHERGCGSWEYDSVYERKRNQFVHMAMDRWNFRHWRVQ